MKRFLTVFAVLLLGTTAWSQSPSCNFVQARSSSGYGNSDPAVITGTAGDTYWVFSSASYLTRPSTTAYVSDGVDTFSQIGSTYNPYGGVTAGAQWYAPNIAGGPVRITTSRRRGWIRAHRPTDRIYRDVSNFRECTGCRRGNGVSRRSLDGRQWTVYTVK